MASAPLLAGIDVGTTGTRCIVFDVTGRRVGSASSGYDVSMPGPGLVEQSVDELLDATLDACRGAVADSAGAGEILAVGLSAQMSTTCPVLADGRALRPLISWEDTRARDQAGWIAARCPPEQFKAIAGAPLAPELVAPTMLWLREHEPEIFGRAVVWPQLQGIVLHALGADDFYLDEPEAFAYGLWDVSERRWSDQLLQVTGIDPTVLGRPVPAGTRVGTVSTDAARRAGFPAGTQLCVGAGDQMCGMVGMGALDARIATSTLGTGGAFQATTLRPRTDLDGLTATNHAVGGRWALFAPTLAAASAYLWFRDQIGVPATDGASFEQLDALAAGSPPGANGALFLPYLNSAGAPHWDTAASGAFLGLTHETVRADLARAVMEGVTHEMLDNLRVLTGNGIRPEVIRAGGGAARSDLWRHIQADMYGLPVECLRESEASALGAAMLAGVGAEVFASLDEAEAAMVHVTETLEPDTERHARYGELHEVYDEAYDALDRSVFERLAAARDLTSGPG